MWTGSPCESRAKEASLLDRRKQRRSGRPSSTRAGTSCPSPTDAGSGPPQPAAGPERRWSRSERRLTLGPARSPPTAPFEQTSTAGSPRSASPLIASRDTEGTPKRAQRWTVASRRGGGNHSAAGKNLACRTQRRSADHVGALLAAAAPSPVAVPSRSRPVTGEADMDQSSLFERSSAPAAPICARPSRRRTSATAAG
jgi:hypothetical protein